MTTRTLSDNAAPPPPLPKSLTRLVLVVIAGTFVVQMDGTMMGVALNAIRQQFTIDVATLQWVTTGYLLSMTLVIPVTGWAMTRFGARPLWLGCLALFAVASLGCTLAPSATTLIVIRVVQGLAGGMLIPLGQALLAQAAGPDQLGRLMGAIGLPAMVGVVLGPVIGGVIVTHLGWQWIFWLNLPIALIAIAASLRFMPPTTASRGKQALDRLGLALLPPGLALFVYGLSRAGSEGSLTAPAVSVPMMLGAVLVVAFIWHALRSRHPLIDLHLFGRRSFAAATTVMFLFGFAMFGLVLLVPLYLQQARGWSALHAGMLALPQGLGMAIALVGSGRLSNRVGPRKLVLVGLALTLAGLAILTQVTDNTSQALLAVAGLIAGLGLGATTVPATMTSYRDVAKEAIPNATSAIRIFQQLGGSFGFAILAVILQNQIYSTLADTKPPSPAGLSSAFATTFTWALIVAALALIPALLLPNNPVDAK